MCYRVAVIPKPNEGEDWLSPTFGKRSFAVAKEVQERYEGRAKNVVIEVGPKRGEPKWVNAIVLNTDDKCICLELFALACDDVDRLSIKIEASNEASTIVNSRWVWLAADRDYADCDLTTYTNVNIYEVVCPTCGRIDTDNPPNPYLVHPWIRKYPSQELFHAHNGMFVLRRRVKDLLQPLLNSQVTWGSARLVDHSTKDDELFWLRPIHQVGEGFARILATPCPTCGRPQDETWANCLKGNCIKDFGDNEWNIALVGALGIFGFNDEGTQPPSHDVVTSGGLFAYLWNHNVNGIVWPHEGPYISIRPDQPTLEEQRRFDVFSKKEDKVLRKKVTDKDIWG